MYDINTNELSNLIHAEAIARLVKQKEKKIEEAIIEGLERKGYNVDDIYLFSEQNNLERHVKNHGEEFHINGSFFMLWKYPVTTSTSVINHEGNTVRIEVGTFHYM